MGEQPGDSEDRQGQPSSGRPAGFSSAPCRKPGSTRGRAYVTNAVKHFRFTTKGKRIHATPSRWHVTACGPWLLAEFDGVRPSGWWSSWAHRRSGGVRAELPGRGLAGRPLEALAGWRVEGPVPTFLATVHPSSVLRSRNRDDDHAALVADLRVVADHLS